MELDVQKELEHVEGILEDIRKNTAVPWWRSVMNGILYGGGVVMGTVIAIAALGWLLSIFGIIPGFGELATRLQEIINSKF
jgi:hypothetical protein